MRIIKRILIIALVLLLAGQVVTTVYKSRSDKNDPPRIQCDCSALLVSATCSDLELLQGGTASDAQDGDLTGQIMSGSISKLISNDTAKVTYMVFDSDHNLATFVRKIQYTDYEKPRFVIDPQVPLVYTNVENIALLERVGATDVFDGDISDRVRVSTLAATADARIHDVTVQVTNAMGDTAWLKLPVLELPFDERRPQIRLKEYLIYLEQGQSFVPSDYLASVTKGDGTAVESGNVTVAHAVDTSKPGDYRVTYTYQDNGVEGMAVLTVVIQ